MAEPMQSEKSKGGSLESDDDFVLPVGETMVPPNVNSIEDLLVGFEPFRRYWMEHFYDPEERLASKNPERFEM